MRCFTIVQALPSHVIKPGFMISLSLPTLVHPHVVCLYDPVAGPQYYKEYLNTEKRKGNDIREELQAVKLRTKIF
jgi:hypothetical protein